MTAPRHLAHRGSVIAIGVVLDPALVGIAEARRRALACWSPGAVVIEADGLLVVTGVRAFRVRAERAPGAPLVDQHGVTATMPLEPAEARAFATGSIVLARGGVAAPLTAERSVRVDLASWIDLDDHTVVAVAPLAPPPARAIAPAAEPLDLRAAAGVAPADREASTVQAALRRALGGAAPGPATATGRAGVALRPSRWRRLIGWLSERLAARDAGLALAPTPTTTTTTTTRGAPTGRSAPDHDASLAPRPPPRPSWLSRLRDRVALALWRSRLGDALGRRHAEYLRRMLEMFDRGELDQALRHAIPIDGGDGGDQPPHLALGVPQPRRDLALSMAPPGARSTIPVAESATAMLRQRYRAALARLEQQGRVDDAAFVLAELLADVAGAIALLERHRRFELAARLAEARGLAPGLIVRLWFLAGERERAVLAARRHQAWADAVARLDQGGQAAEAGALRLRWARQLADGGDFAQAVAVAWPVARDSDELAGWIDRGIAAEGSPAARLLIKKLIIAPAAFATVTPSIVALLDDDDPDAAWRRLALIETLVASPATAELRTIARAAVRALIADVGRGADGDFPALLPRLVRFADDAALRADQPPFAVAPARPALIDRDQPLALTWDAADAGLVPVHDVALVPGGRLLVALGELGVRLIGRDGRTVGHIEQPATGLVVASQRAHALATIRRGGALRVARVDLAQRRGEHWCDAACDGGAATYDGDQWWTSRDGELLAIDATAPGWKAIWGVDLAQGPCTIRRDGPMIAVETAVEAWFYERVTLRARRDRPPPSPVGTTLALARPAGGDWISVQGDGQHDALVVGERLMILGDGVPCALEADGRVAAIAQRRADRIRVTVAHLERMRAIATLDLGGATTASIRLDDGMLAVGDDRGRALLVDLRAGALRRDLRVAI